jgi:rRNA maturation endonuclease Nob1
MIEEDFILQINVAPVLTICRCPNPECIDGELVYMPHGIQCKGPNCKKPHRCEICGHRESLSKTFPRITYKRISVINNASEV